MERITITIDDELLATIDSLVKRRGYPSRSEAVRELVRETANRDYAKAARSPCVATLSYVFDHNTRELSQRLANDYHDHHDLSLFTSHVHFDHESCLEISVLKGRTDTVQSFADAVTTQRGVRNASLHIIPLKAAPHRHSHDSGPPHTHDSL